MPFAYYARLSRRQRAIYDKSAGVTEVRLPGAEPLRPVVAALAEALAREARRESSRAPPLDARGPPAAGGGLPDVPPDAAARALPPPGLPAFQAPGLLS